MSLAFNHGGDKLAAATPESVLRVFDSESTDLLFEIDGAGAALNAIAFSTDGRWLVAGGDDRAVRIWDAESGQIAAVCELESPVQSIRFSADGKTLFFTESGTGSILCAPMPVAGRKLHLRAA